jgi:dihydroxyacetone kinase
MKTFSNDAERCVEEMLEGIVAAHPGAVSGSLIVRTVVQYVIEEGPP